MQSGNHSKFWEEYTDRNEMTTREMDTMYSEQYGVSRSNMNSEFIGNLDRGLGILEVGCGAGTQLGFLKKMGSTCLYGLESNFHAYKKAIEKGFKVIWENASEMFFSDNSFDMVFTSGLLIHISPDELPVVMNEIVRCSRKWVWGFEYYADEMTEIEYRGHDRLLWKANYPELYCGVKVAKVKKYERKDGNTDVMFLLEKKW